MVLGSVAVMARTFYLFAFAFTSVVHFFVVIVLRSVLSYCVLAMNMAYVLARLIVRMKYRENFAVSCSCCSCYYCYFCFYYC